MKQLLFILLGLAIVNTHYAQSHTAKFSSNSGDKKVTLLLSDGEVKVSTHASPEVVISTDDYEAPPERARGLRPLYNNAVDNTGLGLEVQEDNNEIIIKKASSEHMDFEVRLPESVNLHIEEDGWTCSGIHVKGVKGEIEIKAKGSNILIENAKGPVVASTVNGDVEITYSALSPDQPNYISCTNGFIDITLPSTTPASLRMKSINGEVYTDFDITMPQKSGMKRLSGHKLSGTINGGGVEISLNAINDDIYLRKGN